MSRRAVRPLPGLWPPYPQGHLVLAPPSDPSVTLDSVQTRAASAFVGGCNQRANYAVFRRSGEVLETSWSFDVVVLELQIWITSGPTQRSFLQEAANRGATCAVFWSSKEVFWWLLIICHCWNRQNKRSEALVDLLFFCFSRTWFTSVPNR